jgi:ABC-type Mn2+/Zn2+ transport system ATPase subunit
MPSLFYPKELHQAGAPALRLEDVSVRYNGTPALEDVSLQIGRGEQVAVVGPNGAGKSTLFNVIAGIVRPTRGTVSVYGSGPSGHICVGYVPQRNRIDWRFPVTVADTVMMGRIGRIGLFRWPRRQDRERVDQALEQVGMHPFARRQIGELSGGQQQRVFLARALAQEAELLLLD